MNFFGIVTSKPVRLIAKRAVTTRGGRKVLRKVATSGIVRQVATSLIRNAMTGRGGRP